MVERSEGSSEALLEAGITRREALKRGAIAGGAVVWAAPLVQAVGMTSAHAQTGTPIQDLKGISFIVFRFVCDGVTYGAKVDDPGTAEAVCEPIPPPTSEGQNCGIDPQPGDQNGCGLFTIVVTGRNEDGEVTEVRVVFNDPDCRIIEGSSKCALTCVPGSGNSFFGCPQVNPNP